MSLLLLLVLGQVISARVTRWLRGMVLRWVTVTAAVLAALLLGAS